MKVQSQRRQNKFRQRAKKSIKMRPELTTRLSNWNIKWQGTFLDCRQLHQANRLLKTEINSTDRGASTLSKISKKNTSIFKCTQFATRHKSNTTRLSLWRWPKKSFQTKTCLAKTIAKRPKMKFPSAPRPRSLLSTTRLLKCSQRTLESSIIVATSSSASLIGEFKSTKRAGTRSLLSRSLSI